MAVEQFLTHWGVAAVFVGAMAEGESLVIGGGALAQRGLLPAWQVALAAFLGSVTMDQFCFFLGRRCRGLRWVRRIREKPACARAIGFVERHPTGYILGFRYLYGLRIVSPLAIGLTRVAAKRFLLLNLASAAAWAILFTAIGYAAGGAVERMFGRVHSALLILAVILFAAASAAVAHHLLRSRRAERDRNAGVTAPGTTGGVWPVADIDRDERVVVEKSNVNIGGIIAAIALLIAVLGVLKYFGMLPF